MPARSPAAGAVGLLVAVAVAASACTSSSNVDPYDTLALPSLMVAVTTDPPPRDDGTVPRNARIVVQLDDYPDPGVVRFGPITLNSGRATFDFGAEVDLVGRAVVVTPRSLLVPGGQYTVVVSGLVALDGRVQAADVAAPIQVGLDDGAPRPPRPAPTWNGDAEGHGGVREVLATCAPFCHSPVGASGRARTPTRLLDLTGDPRDPTYGLIGVASVGLRGTEQPLMRVAPRDPAGSVLLRKLIGGNPQANSMGPAYPNMRVDGQRMPIDLQTEQATAPLGEESLRLVQDWIAAGAPIQ
jgi:hypothetical protein